MALSAAVFIDKDGTLVHDLPYNVDPRRIALREGAGPALARLQSAGYVLILVSNQPGVAYGFFAEAALAAVWAEIDRQLVGHGVRLAGHYYCPHHPDGRDARYAVACRCRKPRPGLLLRAARDHRLELARSWMIGDILDDVEAGHAAGCRSLLLDIGSETEWRDGTGRQPDRVAREFGVAAEEILTAPEAADGEDSAGTDAGHRAARPAEHHGISP